MTSNNIKTGYCSQCGTYNSSSLRCNCANKVLEETPSLVRRISDKSFPIFSKPTPITPKYYGAKCKCGAKLDPYVICDAYSTTKDKGSAWNHAVKKLLRAGDGHKLLHQDIQEVIDTLKRWQEQINA